MLDNMLDYDTTDPAPDIPVQNDAPRKLEAIVIDADGVMLTNVIADLSHYDSTGQPVYVPRYHTLAEGESLVLDDIGAALEMIRAHWDGEHWEETATPDELAAREADRHPQPAPDQSFGSTEADAILNILLGVSDNG